MENGKRRNVLLSLDHWERTRKSRRLLVVGWICLLGFVLWIAWHSIHLTGDGIFAFIATLGIMAMAAHGFRRAWIGMAQPSLEDRAVVECGVAYEELTETQRVKLLRGHVREIIRGSRRPDEREAVLRLRAEGVAFRILRPALVLFVLGYWAVCLVGRFDNVRGALAVSAVVISWLVMGILALPVAIRLWTEPDIAYEPQAAPESGEAQH